MRSIFLFALSVALGASGTVIFSNDVSQAKITSADLAVTGTVAGGVKGTERFHLVVFVFTLTNQGPDGTGEDSADLVLTDLVGGTTADVSCVLPNGFAINPDGWFCETGPLQPGHSVQATFVVQPSGASPSVSARACASNEGEVPDPQAGNNCAVLSVSVL